MRFDAITIKHLGPFEDVHIDFSKTQAKLIAITGDNGAGKSTLLELLPAALYRQCPTRGSLIDLATARDAQLSVRLQNGSPTTYTLVQKADCISKKGEALVLSHTGQSLVDSAKVREVDAWVGAHFPSADVLYASAFLAQGSSGFLQLSPVERKRVLVRLLQIERLEALAERARSRERMARQLVSVAVTRVSDIRNQYPDAENAALDLSDRQAELEAASAELTAAAELVKRARDAEAAAPLRARQTQIARDIRDLQERIRNNKVLMLQRDDITLAQSQAADYTTKEREQQELVSRAQAKEAKLDAQCDAATTQRENTRDRAEAAAQWLADTRQALKGAKASARKAEAIPKLQQQQNTAAETQLKLEEEIGQLEAQLAQGLTLRVRELRHGLDRIVHREGKSTAIALTTLQEDDARAADATQAPSRIGKARLKLAKVRSARNAADAAVTDAKIAKQSANVEKWEADEQKALAESERLGAELTAEGQKIVSLSNDLRAARAAVTRATAERDKWQTALKACAPRLALVPKLAQAEARLQELQPQLVRLGTEHAAVTEQLDALPRVECKTTVADAQAREETARLARQRASHEVMRAEDMIKRAAEGQALLATRQGELEAAEREARDYGRLGKDLGKDGLQAMEIDAALPELQTLANDLLHTCHGSRFTVQLSTTALSSDGKRSLEALEVRVIDTEHGRDDVVETYSGGEKVIIGEALSLALTMIACRAAGLERPTLVRDESGAALDPENGRAYVAMLRRAADLLKADKVLYVSHTPELQALADATIEVKHGQAVLRDSQN